MQYTVQDAARLLKVSEETIYRFIREENFPAVQFNDRYHINRQRLIEWAQERHFPLVVEAGERLPALDDALTAGDVLHGIEGETKRDVLRAITERMPLPESVDRQFLFDMIWSREQMSSTGFGKGIAIPHARRPIMLDSERPLMTAAFLGKPVDFNAVDGQPVSAIFMLVTSTIRIHLHLLARLGNALNDSEFLRLIQAQSDKETMLTRLRELEYSAKNPASSS